MRGLTITSIPGPSLRIGLSPHAGGGRDGPTPEGNQFAAYTVGGGPGPQDFAGVMEFVVADSAFGTLDFTTTDPPSWPLAAPPTTVDGEDTFTGTVSPAGGLTSLSLNYLCEGTLYQPLPSSLEYFSMSNCPLTGTINTPLPEGLLSFSVNDCPSLAWNSVAAPLPEGLLEMQIYGCPGIVGSFPVPPSTITSYYISSAGITGMMPDISGCTALEYIDVSECGLTGLTESADPPTIPLSVTGFYAIDCGMTAAQVEAILGYFAQDVELRPAGGVIDLITNEYSATADALRDALLVVLDTWTITLEPAP